MHSRQTGNKGLQERNNSETKYAQNRDIQANYADSRHIKDYQSGSIYEQKLGTNAHQKRAICVHQNQTVSAIGSETSKSPPASSPDKQALPLDLQAILDAWDTLPAAVKAGILAMVQAARAGASE